MSVFSFDGMVDFVEFRKGSIEVSITVLGANCVSGFGSLELGKEFKALSISMICALNRFRSNRISMCCWHYIGNCYMYHGSNKLYGGGRSSLWVCVFCHRWRWLHGRGWYRSVRSWWY